MSGVPAGAAVFSARALAYLGSHAIDPGVAVRVGVTEAGGALRFPYLAPDGQPFTRARALDGGPAKVRQPRGMPLCLWWPAGRPVDGESVLVCEGEPDALAALSALEPGLPTGPVRVCALPGTGYSATRLCADLAELEPGAVYLCLDADQAGRAYAAEAADALRRGLSASVLLIELADGQDLADALGGADEPAELLGHLLLDADAAEEAERQEAVRGGAEPSQADGHLTDLGNARRLVNGHGDDLRYCHEWESWLVFRGSFWERDRDAEIARRAKQTVLSLYGEAAAAHDADARKAIVKHAVRSEAEARIRAMERLARSDAQVVARAEQFDSDPWLLNCANGTLDLRSGYLRPHAREELHTKIAPAHYDPDARCADWTGFLDDVTGGSDELRGFLQRAVGYSLTGSTDEEVLFFAYGPAATGKSTFLEAVKRTLGSYAQTADFSTFLKQRGGGPRNDIARLAGARLVASLEVDEGERLAESLVKTLTGGDVVSARFLYREAFEFRPQFKLWLAANDQPRVSERDEAMWRRILCLPFTEVVPQEQRDRRLKARLADVIRSGPAILAWAVEGCLEWQRYGLGVPDVVREATESYRRAMDPLADWLEECCAISPGEVTASSALWDDYQRWASTAGAEAVSRQRFTERLAQLDGVATTRIGKSGQRGWRGVGLLAGPRRNG